MTLLAICQQVANSVGIVQPVSIIGNPGADSRKLLAAAQDEGEALARTPPGGWISQIFEYDFTTVSIGPLTGTVANSGAGGVAQITGLSSTTGITPALAFYCTGDGLKNNTTVVSVDGPTQVTLNQAASTVGAGSYTFSQSDYALPNDFQRIVDDTLWDRSRFWLMRGPLSPQQWQLYKSSVIGKASIQRRWRMRRIAGQNRISIDPQPTDNGSALVLEYVSNAWCQSATGTRQTSWAADTDTGIVDEYLLRLGIKWRMKYTLGMVYAMDLSEYEDEVDKAMAHDGGAAILDLSPPEGLTLLGPWNIPETGFGGVSGG